MSRIPTPPADPPAGQPRSSGPAALVVKLLLAAAVAGGLGYAGVALFGGPAVDPALHGRWQEVETESTGQRRQSGPIIATLRATDLVYEPGRFHSRGRTFRPVLDPTSSPKRLDWVVDETPIKPGLRWLGIYRVEGDTLTVCVNRKKDGQRPTEFVTPPDDDGHMLLVVYQRYTGPATTEGLPPDPVTTDLRTLQGRWQVLDPGPAGPGELRFASDQMIVAFGAGRPDDRYRLHIDTTRSPVWIDLTPLAADGGPAADTRPLLGVYRLGAGRLAVRWGDHLTRPGSLAERGDTSGPAVYRLERVPE